MSAWQVWLDDPTGNRLAVLDRMINLSVSVVANNIGSFQITLPGDFDDSLIHLDSLIEFWRAPEGGTLRLVRVGMVRKWVYTEDSNGSEVLIISGPDQTELLSRRIVAYPAEPSFATGTKYTYKSGAADDMIKAIVRENLGALVAVAVRNLTSLNFTVALDLTAVATLERRFSWTNVLTVIQEIASASTQSTGIGLYFDLVPVMVSSTQLGFELRTYTGQIGMDMSSSVFFGKSWGNLGSPKLEKDYSAEFNYCYVGGQGEEADRSIVEVSDTARIGGSPWNRREIFQDGRNEKTVTGLDALGRKALRANRPVLRLSGALLDTTQTRYGIDWSWGDKVTVEYRGFQFAGMVRAVRFDLADDGQEVIDCKVETEVV